MLNHIHAQVFIETFLYAFFQKRMDRVVSQFNSHVYIVDQVSTLRNEGRKDAFTNFSFTIGANFRQDEQAFAKDVMFMLMAALNENFNNADVGIDWTDWCGTVAERQGFQHGFPECRICVNVY